MMKQVFIVLAMVALAFAGEQKKTEQKVEVTQHSDATAPATLQWVNQGGLLRLVAARPANIRTTTTTKVTHDKPAVAVSQLVRAATPVVTTRRLVASAPVVAHTVAHSVAYPAYNTWAYPSAALAYPQAYAQAYPQASYVASAPLVSSGYYGYGLNSPLTYANYVQLLKKKK